MLERSQTTPDDLMDLIKDEVKSEKQKIDVTTRFMKYTLLTDSLEEVINLSLPDFHTDTNIHIWNFLKYHDLSFILLAYKGVLKRKADPEDLCRYLSLLREGKITRPEIIHVLKNSAEGKSAQSHISYLTPFYMISRFYRRLLKVPVLGWCIRLLLGLIMLPRYTNIIGARIDQNFASPLVLDSSVKPLLLQMATMMQQMQETMVALIKAEDISDSQSKSLIGLQSKLKELENKINSIHKDMKRDP